MNRFIPIVLIITLILGSCTIEKRTFNRGYHVSWNKKVIESAAAEDDLSLEDGLSTTKDEIKTTEELAEKEEAVATIEAETEPVVVPSAETDLNPPRRKSVEFVESSQSQILAESPTSSPDTVYVDPVFEPNGVGSFVVGVLSGAAFFGVTTGMTGLLFLMIPLTIVGLVLGIMSIVRYQRNPAAYRGNVFGILGVVLNGLGLTITVYVIAILIIVFASL